MSASYHILKLWQRGTSLPIYLSKVIRNFVIDFHRSKRKREESVGGLAELEPLGEAQGESITTGILMKELRSKGMKPGLNLKSAIEFLYAANFIVI